MTCEAGFTGGAFLEVTQRSSKTVAHGAGTVSPLFVCAGEPQVVTVRVVADPGGAPFKVGEAVVQGQFSACNEFGSCEFLTPSDTVRVRR